MFVIVLLCNWFGFLRAREIHRSLWTKGVFLGNNEAVLCGFFGSLEAKRSANSGLLSCIDPVPDPVVGSAAVDFAVDVDPRAAAAGKQSKDDGIQDGGDGIGPVRLPSYSSGGFCCEV